MDKDIGPYMLYKDVFSWNKYFERKTNCKCERGYSHLVSETDKINKNCDQIMKINRQKGKMFCIE